MSDQLTEKVREEIRENVRRGIALLDEKAPYWRSCIDLGDLIMSNSRHCIIGQTFPDEDYEDALEELGVSGWDAQAKHGFCVETFWEDLRNLWIEEGKLS